MPRKQYRKLPFCKPCWELKYCPYGFLVEYMPLHPEEMREGYASDDETNEQMFERAVRMLRERTDFSDYDDVMQALRFVLFADPETWEAVRGYNPEDVNCRVFGHVCPVFAYGYAV